MDGLPLDKEYLESDLPPCLQKSILKMQDAWKKINKGESYSLFDCDYCELQSEINIAEVNSNMKKLVLEGEDLNKKIIEIIKELGE